MAPTISISEEATAQSKALKARMNALRAEMKALGDAKLACIRQGATVPVLALCMSTRAYGDRKLIVNGEEYIEYDGTKRKDRSCDKDKLMLDHNCHKELFVKTKGVWEYKGRVQVTRVRARVPWGRDVKNPEPMYHLLSVTTKNTPVTCTIANDDPFWDIFACCHKTRVFLQNGIIPDPASKLDCGIIKCSKLT